MTIQIVEIIGRSVQGVTRPFLCRGEDGRQYYVKGRGAGRRALIAEWLAGQLGLRMGLPIPPFVQASIPDALVRFSARSDIQELGAGVGFGSRLIENVDELPCLFIEQIDPQLRAKILLFDWWTGNGDRTLTPDGGNVNLLWSHRDRTLHVIDQNLAFDETPGEGFWQNHVFRDSVIEWTPAFRVAIERTMVSSVEDLPRWWREMPEEWAEIETGLTLEGLTKLLWRFESDGHTFWRTT